DLQPAARLRVPIHGRRVSATTHGRTEERSSVRRLRYVTADVFTDQRFGGNPLAVVPDARGLTDEQMLAITREFNYSESTFVLPPENDGQSCRVRIFTPGGEVPFAGHPTVGTAIVLTAIRALPLTGDETRLVLGENVGPVPVTVRSTDGRPHPARLP